MNTDGITAAEKTLAAMTIRGKHIGRRDLRNLTPEELDIVRRAYSRRPAWLFQPLNRIFRR